MAEPIRIQFAGGADEIGGSCIIMETGRSRVFFDFGTRLGAGTAPRFPGYTEEPLPGQTLFLTHAHLDHTGGLTLFRELFPETRIIGSPITAVMTGVRGDSRSIDTVQPWESVSVGDFTVTCFPVLHSVPGACGFIVRTSERVVVLSGDFTTDCCSGESRAVWEGVRKHAGGTIDLFLCDGTGLLRPEPGITEAEAAARIMDIFVLEQGDIYATCFSSNWHRIAALCSAAVTTGRSVYCAGTSLQSTLRAAASCSWQPLAGIDIPLFKGQSGPKLVIAAGSQGESRSGFYRMSGDEGPVTSEDAIIFSASPVPGNELAVKALLDRFSRQTNRLYCPPLDPVHASGHASRKEIAFVLDILQPEAWFPVHTAPHYAVTVFRGDLKQPVPYLPSRGTVLEVGASVTAVVTGEPSRRVITSPPLEEKQRLYEEGFIHFTLLRRAQRLGGVTVATRGFVRRKDAAAFLEEAALQVEGCAEEAVSEGVLGSAGLAARLQQEASDYIFRATGRSPEVLVTVTEIPPDLRG